MGFRARAEGQHATLNVQLRTRIGRRTRNVGATFLSRPEVRKYRVIYVVNDKETGEMSEEAVVTCQP